MSSSSGEGVSENTSALSVGAHSQAIILMAAAALPNLSTPERASTQLSVSGDTPCHRSSGPGSVGEKKSDLELRLEEAVKGRIATNLPIPTGLLGSEVEEVVGRLVEEGLLNQERNWVYWKEILVDKRVVQCSGKRVFMDDFGSEWEMEHPVQHFLATVHRILQQPTTVRLQSHQVTPDCNRDFDVPTDPTTRARPNLVAAPSSDVSSNDGAIPWSRVSYTVELKLKAAADPDAADQHSPLVLQMSRYALKAVECQPGLSRQYGLTVCGRTARLWRFDSRQVWRTSAVDIHDNITDFIQIIAFLGTAAARARFAHLRGQKFTLSRPLPHLPSSACDAEFVWMDDPAVVFASKQLFGRRTTVLAGKLRRAGLAEGAAGTEVFEAAVKLSHVGVNLGAHEAQLIADMEKERVFGAARLRDSGVWLGNPADDLPPLHNLPDSAPHVLIFDGTPHFPLRNAKSSTVLARALRDAVRGIWAPFVRLGICHRDISAGNVMLQRDDTAAHAPELNSAALEPAVPWPTDSAYGVVIDWGNAKRHGTRRAPASGHSVAVRDRERFSSCLAVCSRRCESA